jgi:hypothetical protein
MIVTPASLRFDFIHIAGMRIIPQTIHIALESTISHHRNNAAECGRR